MWFLLGQVQPPPALPGSADGGTPPAAQQGQPEVQPRDAGVEQLQEVVDQLRENEERQAEANQELEGIREEATSARLELQQMRQAQIQAAEERARQQQQLISAAAYLQEADALLLAGSFDADGPLSAAESALAGVNRPEAAQVRHLVSTSRTELANRNFWTAHVWVSWAWTLLGQATVVP